MSCIVGIVNHQGKHPDRATLEAMAAALAPRAPDGADIWLTNGVGLGHALLRLSPRQNGRITAFEESGLWLTADARIDGQKELREKLRARRENVEAAATDAELILHAYRAWGEHCLDHLIGDFAFAIWDQRQKKLFCARDHLGVRPFFYARIKECLHFASDIDAILEEQTLPRDLDKGFVADFLLFGGTVDPELTVYKHIHRLPAAHKLVVQSGDVRICRYWSLPPSPEPSLRPSGEYQDAFQDLFMTAVRDRAREDTLAMELSGGMDSGAVAVALSVMARERSLTTFAYTTVSPQLLPEDKEGDFATLTAQYLGLNHQLWNQDSPLFHHWHAPSLSTMEPVACMDLTSVQGLFRDCQKRDCRVLITGQIGDALFAGQNYYRRLIKQRQLVQLCREVWRAGRYRGTLRGLGLRTALLGTTPAPWRSPLPRWIDPAFATEVNLEERWAQCWQAWNNGYGLRRQLEASWLPGLFEGYGVIKTPIAPRHPFADIRLVDFMLGVPNAEVFGKKVLRETLGRQLPRPVRTRRKTPLAGDQVRTMLTRNDPRMKLPSILAHVQEYIDIENYLKNFDDFYHGAGSETTWTSALIITPLALSRWLVNKGYKLIKPIDNY